MHEHMITIRRRVLVIAALGLALGFAIFSPTHNNELTTAGRAVSATFAAPAISIWEMHGLAHLENLPVDDFEDHTGIRFTATLNSRAGSVGIGFVCGSPHGPHSSGPLS